MATTNGIEIDATVTEALPNAMFRLSAQVPMGNGESRGVLILATLSGKMRTRHIRVLPGDKVKVVVVPPDLTKGRVIYRYR
jgi:translation initiation factor IF-1